MNLSYLPLIFCEIVELFVKKLLFFVTFWKLYVNPQFSQQNVTGHFPWVLFGYLGTLFRGFVIRCLICLLFFVKSLNYLWEKKRIFLWISEITGKSIIIYNRMILWILFRDLETILDESGARCPYFLWNRWIICEQLLFFVNFLKFQVKP